MGALPRPASVVVQSAGVAIEAGVVQLLLLLMDALGLLARREVLGPATAHELLRSQLLLLLRGQLPLELGPRCEAQRSQALRVSAATAQCVRQRSASLNIAAGFVRTLTSDPFLWL